MLLAIFLFVGSSFVLGKLHSSVPIRNSDFLFRDLDFPVRNPDFQFKNPDFPIREPGFSSNIPNFPFTSAEVPFRNPDFQFKNPDFPIRDPGFSSNIPNFPFTSAEVPFRNPDFQFKNPDFPIRDPGFSSNIPNFPFTSAEVPFRNPDFQFKNPDFPIRDPGFSSNIPNFPFKSDEVPFRNLRVRDTEIRGECLAAFRSGALDKHNELRDMHGVPRLNLDSNLNSIAQAYSKNLVSIGQLIHSNMNGLGENLAVGFSSVTQDQSADNCFLIGQKITQDWYNEITNYNFNNPDFSMNTGHFTQVVWKDSTDVGFGLGFSNDGNSYFAVANYAPSGNIINGFANNVFQPKSFLNKLM